jgi:DNA-binding LacI/PurR family transcriptional regulator
LKERGAKDILPEPMKPTINDIAKLAGVSKSAVSMRLNRHPQGEHLSSAAKRRIDNAVKELGYQPSFAARALGKGRTQTLGLVLGSLTNEYFSHFADAALEEAGSRGYQTLIALSRWRRELNESCIETLLARQTDGILFYPALDIPDKLKERLIKNRYPFLLLEHESEDFPSAVNDIRKALGDGLKHLRSLGHTSVTGVFGKNINYLDKFESLCRTADLEPLMPPFPISDTEARVKTAKEIVRLRPGAIVTAGRLTAEAILREADKSAPGYRPDIVMHYDFSSSLLEDSRLAGIVRCRSRELVKSAVVSLIQMIGSPDDIGLRRVAVPAEFIPRSGFADIGGDSIGEDQLSGF